MANLLLLKDLLPDLYKVIGTPSRVLIISPFKTPFGYLEAVVEDKGKSFVVENEELPSQFELIGLTGGMRRLKDFSFLPLKVDQERIYFEIPKEGNTQDLIRLAKAVDSFIKDLYDFIRNLLQMQEVRRRVGGVDALIFRFEKLKEYERERLQERAEKLKFEINELYDDIKALLVKIEDLIKRKKYAEADKLLREAIRLLGKMDHLREEYKRITGEDIYSFHTDVLRSTLFALKEEIEGE